MGTPAIGNIVVLAFPFSNLEGAKKRPALVIANAGRGDWVLCQITSQTFGDDNVVALANHDFVEGALNLLSYVRLLKLFTAHETLFETKIALVHAVKLQTIKQHLAHLLSKP